MNITRRRFMKKAGMLVAGSVSAGLLASLAFGSTDHAKAETEVSAVEDLMREHGVLERLLLVYEKSLDQLGDNQAFNPEIVHEAAGWMRRFIEDYHAALEEQYVFPAFRKADKLVSEMDTLEDQHRVGRQLTERILVITAGKNSWLSEKQVLIQAMEGSIEMFRPHAAYEDTVLFPAFKEVVPEKTYHELGEQFEEKEHQLFGETGFQTVVQRVAELEKELGIHDLSQFTPSI